MNYTNDPIFKSRDNQMWYFWDETWSNSRGPYTTEEIAREHLQKYLLTL